MRLLAYAQCSASCHWYSDMRADEVGSHRSTWFHWYSNMRADEVGAYCSAWFHWYSDMSADEVGAHCSAWFYCTVTWGLMKIMLKSVLPDFIGTLTGGLMRLVLTVLPDSLVQRHEGCTADQILWGRKVWLTAFFSPFAFQQDWSELCYVYELCCGPDACGGPHVYNL